MGTIVRVTALAMAIFGIGIAIELAPKTSIPTACTVVHSPVSASCIEHGNTCRYEDGNTDGKECFWLNDGNVWYNDGSEYRN